MKISKNQGVTFTEFNERLPVFQSGLVHHFPMDGAGGAFDIIGGVQSTQNIENGTNLIDLMNIDWRSPSSWSDSTALSWYEPYQALKWVGYHNSWLNTPIIVDTTKSYRISAEVYFESAASNNFYMGGYGETTTGTRYTSNYDYNMACYYDEENNLGKWITFAVTRTGTGSETCQNSFSFATSSGWTGANGVCYKYFFGALFNYSSGGVMYLRNPRIEIYGSDTSNTIVRKSGISTVNAVTNKWTPLTGTRGWYVNYNATATAITDHTSPSDSTDVVELVHPNIASVQPGHWAGTWSTDFFNSTTNMYYTIGSFWKKVNGTSDNSPYDLRLSSWAAADYTNTYSQQDIAIDNEWTFSCRTVKMNSVQSVRPYFECGYQNGKSERYSGMFCVEGTRAIPVGARSSVSKTALSFGSFNDRDNYTVTGWWLPYVPFDNESSHLRNTNGDTLVRFENGAGKGGAYRYYWDPGAPGPAPYMSTDDGVASNAHAWYTMLMYVPVFWAFTKSGTSIVFKMYQNGTLLGTHSATLSQSSYYNLSKIILGGSDTIIDGEHQSISVYSSVLDAATLLNMSKTFAATKSTYDVIKGLTEKDRVISDGYYDSLTGASTEIARHDTPTVVNDEGSYAMTAWTNDATGFSSWGSQRPYTLVNTPYGDGCKYVSGAMTSTWSGNSYAYIGALTLSGTAQYWAASCWTYVSKDSNISWLSLYNEFSSYTDYDLSKKGTWQHLTAYPYLASGSGNCYMYSSINGRTDGVFDGYYIICQPVYIKVASALATTPAGKFSPNGAFSAPSILAGNLTFNLYSTLDLWWSSPWSISYWKYPIATHDGTLTAYNIESMGCNSNSVGGGYRWWGKNNGSNNITKGGGVNIATFTPSDYFNNWQFVSLVYDGSNISYKTWLNNGTLYSGEDTTGTITVNNYYVTQYGYDLNLGGWDDTAHSNTIFRDLRVFKRALSSSEEENLYNLKYRIYKNKAILPSSRIIETG